MRYCRHTKYKALSTKFTSFLASPRALSILQASTSRRPSPSHPQCRRPCYATRRGRLPARVRVHNSPSVQGSTERRRRSLSNLQTGSHALRSANPPSNLLPARGRPAPESSGYAMTATDHRKTLSPTLHPPACTTSPNAPAAKPGRGEKGPPPKVADSSQIPFFHANKTTIIKPIVIAADNRQNWQNARITKADRKSVV